MLLQVTTMLKISKPIFFGEDQNRVSVRSLSYLILGYIPVNIGLSDQDDGMRIMAIGDLNNDKQSDLVTVNGEATTIKA